MPSSPSKLYFSTALLTAFLAIILIPICHSIDKQGQALLEWKRSLNNSVSANSLSSWKDTDSSPCNDWVGVKCDEKGRVFELSLKSIDLQGTLPSNLRQLESLTTLVLSSANLTGKIAPEIGDSVELVFLDLSENFLTGEIPAELFQLRKLKTLTLNTNFLEGPIPEGLGNLSSLESLTLFDNRLAGEIPRSVGVLKKLEIFRVGGNKNLKGPIPPDIGNCESLVVLGLAETGISGSIPASIGNLKRVQTIAVYTSLLSGPIPDEIGNCTDLKNLYLYQNSLSGSIPGSIGRLKSLESVLLWENSLVGTIPEEVGNCSKLRVLDLSENLLVGPIPSSIEDLSKLEELQLSVNKLSGAIPPEISRCSALNHLEIDNNEISGEIPREFGELKKLTILFAWKNRLSGNIPARLSECEKLQALDLSYNSLSGGIPGEIFGLTNLTKLLLLSNELTGFIPTGIRNCASLYRLRLNQNRLSGPIPPEIGELTSLNFLDLSENRLAGPIPRTISGCRSLEFLDLHSNGISGPLPEILPKTLQFADLSRNRLEGPLGSSTIAPLAELTKLSLAGNRLAGGIPPELQFCVRLQLLDLGENFFSGNIPAEIGRIPSLEISLNLSCNQLSGELPNELAGLDKLGVLDISRNNLSGGLESLAGLENLVALNVSHNAFSGKIPDTPFFRKLPLSDINPNAGLFAGPSSSSDPNHRAAAEASPAMKFLTSVLISASAVLVLLAIYLIVRMRMVAGDEASAEAQPWDITFYQKTEISVDDVIRQLTSSNVIGTGSSGVVYRVSLPSGGEWVAVKKMWSSTSTEESASAAAFRSEIKTLGSVRHKNIVRLLGWGSNQAVKLLFYDYLPNGSLSSMISGGAAEWETRYEVVLGVAHALSYLHHDCVPAIMHGDVKAMNVLLGHRNQPFLADFGLARVLSFAAAGDNDNAAPFSPSPPHLAGSYGYMAPEHGSMQRITEKSDVYSFGVVLLEVLTGRHPLDPSLPGGSHLVQWVRDHLASKKEPSEVLDPRLRGRSDPAMHEMLQTLAVSFLCVAARAHDRPAMKDVVAMLTEIRHVSIDDDDNTSRPDVEFTKKSKTTQALTSLPPPPRNMSSVSTRGSSDCSFAFSEDYSMSK